jgi:hypothetical protein
MKLAVQLGTSWAEQDSTGIATDSSGGFRGFPTALCGLQTPRGYGLIGWQTSQRNRSRGPSPSIPTS